MARLLLVPVVLIASAVAYGQAVEKPLAFDVADVHVSSQHSIPEMTGGVLRNGRYTLQNATMLDLIRTAYDTEDDRIAGGPTWLETERFDVIAIAPAGTTRDKVNGMLQTLLAERFGLNVHNGTKSMQAYVLSVGKSGAKMKQAAGSTAERGGCQGQQQPRTAPGAPVYAIVSCHALTAADIAQDLHQIGAGYVGDHPLVDSTRLDGLWDFDLKFSQRNQIATAGAEAITFFDAIDKQLGLKLELRTAPVPVVIVEKVNEKPADNPAGVAELLPPVPSEFEVADVKPSAPEVKGESGGFQPGGRIDLRGFTLKNLMTIAWGLQDNIAGDLFAGPDWFDSARFDVVAKAPVSGPSKADELPLDPETLLTMLRNLVIEQFKLKTHTENREVTVYVLPPPKGDPKLKKAEPADRAGCKRGPGPPNANGTSTIMQSCLNTTMADLAKDLPQWAPAYFDHPVFDATGLTGGWNFSLVWTGRGQLLGDLAPKNGAVAGLSAADPGGVSIFEAVEKQLGFKLETQKRPMPVIVIDHADKLQPE